jgi:hypothetical protein
MTNKDEYELRRFHRTIQRVHHTYNRERRVRKLRHGEGPCWLILGAIGVRFEGLYHHDDRYYNNELTAV